MNRFYESEGGDKLYRAMFLELESTKPARESIRYLLPRYICDINPSECLEIGCGSGRVYRQLREYGLNGNYCGLEPSIGAIKVCREKHPESVWINGTVYDIPCNDNQFDCVFALYVLEHVVFPERALREMIRVVRPGGRLLLVFPDFVETGRLGSQFIGLSPGRVKEKIQSGRILDAFFTAYDSRIRLPQALRTVVRKHGPFPVNLNPAVLSYSDLTTPDVDAVYISSKKEVMEWAKTSGFSARFPFGDAGNCKSSAFIEINKS